MAKFLLIPLIAYCLIVAALVLSQRHFLYPAPPAGGGVPIGFTAIEYPTSDGLTLRAGYRAAAPDRPTIVYFHGNGADWQSSVVATDRLVPAGYGVLAAEYRGYQGNPGNPSEKGLYSDGRAAIAWLQQQGVDRSNLVMIGNSIGGGVATQMASEGAAAALVLISPFNSLSQLVAEKMPWLPTSLLLRDHYRNDQKLAEIDAPILILHGDADTLIPVGHARQLAATNNAAQLEIFPGAGHDLAWQDSAERRVLDFLNGNAGKLTALENPSE
ncbi:alpha/beta hydrolase [Parerythrobacter jejuensis]|uniref:Alpha/beta fold hydrolase n=1 Tax=Parerythrobacter jejuensis TaxID=795812 RepID=A0A845AX94_9SPHN|nr:alpha/beta fold hydrolase [Parerythrobacter jejuensis]MXP31043.1 alpha/beta fold hydrolase [Parerythrobacter jejuensis]MXP33803.1 alpha/beta fold hydrolase [Parerythrobacter jejuensis]